MINCVYEKKGGGIKRNTQRYRDTGWHKDRLRENRKRKKEKDRERERIYGVNPVCRCADGKPLKSQMTVPLIGLNQ